MLELVDILQAEVGRALCMAFISLLPFSSHPSPFTGNPWAALILNSPPPSRSFLSVNLSAAAASTAFPWMYTPKEAWFMQKLLMLLVVTCNDPSPQAQRALHQFSHYFRYYLMFSPFTTQWVPTSSLAIYKLIHGDEHPVLFPQAGPLGSFSFPDTFPAASSCPALTLALPFYAPYQKRWKILLCSSLVQPLPCLLLHQLHLQIMANPYG